MPRPDHMYEDKWGACIDRPDAGYIEIRWYDATSDLTAEEFNQWIKAFSDAVLERERQAILVDGVNFRMNPEFLDAGWRDAYIVPTYNRAGVKKFAFLMPEGMPAIGAPPSVEGPADYPTAYFGRRQDALDWLAAD